MLSDMVETLPSVPRKKQLVQYYSHVYYHDDAKGIKAFINRTWPAEQMRQVLQGQKKLNHLDYGNNVTAEFFARETVEFKVQLEKEHREIQQDEEGACCEARSDGQVTRDGN